MPRGTWRWVWTAIAWSSALLEAAPVTTAFTYQGQLRSEGSPVNGPHDLRFRLFDAAVAGAQVGPTVCVEVADVVNGLFTVSLDFGTQFSGDKRFLEVEARADVVLGNCAAGVFTLLSPRQELQAAPYAQAVRLPLVEQLDTNGSVVQLTNNGTGRVLQVTRGGAGGLSAIRADSAGDSAVFAQGNSATAEGVTAVSTGGAHALVAQSQGATGRAANFNISNAANPDPALVAATAGTGPAALIDGPLELGSETTESGDLRLFRAGSASAVLHGYANANGGNLDLLDDAGNLMAGFEADNSGTGGFAYVRRSTGSVGFEVDGNSGGSGNTKVSITGAARSAVFDMDAVGNASVVLPADAVSAPECFDEPGVASATNSDGVAIASTTLATILSRTITAPAAGFVLVLGMTQFQIPHTTGTNDLYNIGVSDSSTALPANQDLLTTVVAALPTATYQKIVSPHGLFAVSAGVNTFFLLGEKTSSTSVDATAFDSQLTLIYFATAYGTVTSTLLNTTTAATNDSAALDESAAPVRAGLTELEVALEREESIAANQVRMERELTEMRTRFDALQRELEETMRAQQAAAREVRVRKAVPPIAEGDE